MQIGLAMKSIDPGFFAIRCDLNNDALMAGATAHAELSDLRPAKLPTRGWPITESGGGLGLPRCFFA